MRPAHCRETVPIRENLREPRIDAALVVAFVLDHVLLDDDDRFHDSAVALSGVGLFLFGGVDFSSLAAPQGDAECQSCHHRPRFFL
jgi:hypothetical protein